MTTISYICIGLCVLLLVIVVKIIRIKEKKRILRYHGIIVKRRK